MSAEDESGFLARWARRKADARRGVEPQAPSAPVATRTTPPGAPRQAVVPTAAVAETSPAPAVEPGATPDPASSRPPPPTLDDVARLTRESDYARFVVGDVDPGVRNAAMRKLFSDPRFNLMDGLDVYIDDYGRPDPLPPGMLRRLVQSRSLGLFDDEERVEPASTRHADTPATTTTASAPAAPTAPPDEDPDLRLQPDDAAGAGRHEPDRAGAGEDPAGQR
ncbi:MAG: DUF3306 domain-containing protein [Burkholderiales bacterium]|nr:DUF3306 domain-containing protein [Burkholderiales bacterium]